MTARPLVPVLVVMLATVYAAAESAPWIEWDTSTRMLVQKGAGYARIVRLTKAS